jgi:hypothetical protein
MSDRPQGLKTWNEKNNIEMSFTRRPTPLGPPLPFESLIEMSFARRPTSLGPPLQIESLLVIPLHLGLPRSSPICKRVLGNTSEASI